MAYTTFSTEDADYYLVYGSHQSQTMIKIFNWENIKNLDAIVFETRGTPALKRIINFRQYKSTFETIKKYSRDFGRCIPVYFVDLDMPIYSVPESFYRSNPNIFSRLINKKETNLALEEILGDKIGEIRHLKDSNSKILRIKKEINCFLASNLEIGFGEVGKLRKRIAKKHSIYEYLLSDVIVGLRNAIVSKKISEFIVPQIKNKFQKIPKIAIEYGFCHSGIEFDLLYPSIRDTVIEGYAEMDYLGIEKSALESVFEARYEKRENEFEWILRRYMTNLF